MDGDAVRMYGMLPFTTRMTVVRLESGGVWLHSPVKPTPERRRAVDQLGPVEHLVAPNKIHSLGIKPWKALYPSAKVWASPGFSKRHPDIAVDALLTNAVEVPWRGEIDHCSGCATVRLHRAAADGVPAARAARRGQAERVT